MAVVEHQMLAAVDDSSRHPSSKAVHPLQQRRGEPCLATERTAADRSGMRDRVATLRLGREARSRARTDRRSAGVSLAATGALWRRGRAPVAAII
jgi:hypothetical protein